MKYIKTYENIEYNNNLSTLSNHLISFLIEITDLKITSSTNNINYTFWYNTDLHYRKAIFKILTIDYYHSDEDMFFEFKLDISILKNSQIDYVPEDLFDAIIFISNIMKKYHYSQNMIKMPNIENIITDINVDDYKIFLTQNKYNL